MIRSTHGVAFTGFVCLGISTFLALGTALTAETPPKKPGVGLHYFTRKSPSEASNKPATSAVKKSKSSSKATGAKGSRQDTVPQLDRTAESARRDAEKRSIKNHPELRVKNSAKSNSDYSSEAAADQHSKGEPDEPHEHDADRTFENAESRDDISGLVDELIEADAAKRKNESIRETTESQAFSRADSTGESDATTDRDSELETDASSRIVSPIPPDRLPEIEITPTPQNKRSTLNQSTLNGSRYEAISVQPARSHQGHPRLEDGDPGRQVSPRLESQIRADVQKELNRVAGKIKPHHQNTRERVDQFIGNTLDHLGQSTSQENLNAAAKSLPARSTTGASLDATVTEQVPPQSANLPAASHFAEPASPLPRLDDRLVDAPAGLEIAWVFPDNLSIGDTGRATLVVKNSGRYEAARVTVRGTLSKSLVLVQSKPVAVENGTDYVWKCDKIPAGGSRMIDLVVRAVEAGDGYCLAEVTSSQTSSRKVRLLQPEIDLQVQVPEVVTAGEPLAAIVRVSNVGKGTVRDVTADIVLSSGLAHPKGKSFQVVGGALAQGESRQLTVPLSSISDGNQEVIVQARGKGTAAVRASANVQVAAPQLALSLKGPGKRFVGRPAKYIVRLANEGSATAMALTVRLKPTGAVQFNAASDQGVWNAEANAVEWFVPELSGNTSLELSTDLVPETAGSLPIHVTMENEQGVSLRDQTETMIEAVSRLDLEIVNHDDPVELGVETTWEVRIRNNGSLPANKVRILSEIPPEVRLVNATGPTKSATDRELIAFGAIKELKPGGTAVYFLKVVGKAPGNHRVKVWLSADENAPVLSEKMTRFYQD